MQTKSVLTEQKNQPGWSIFLPYANWFKRSVFQFYFESGKYKGKPLKQELTANWTVNIIWKVSHIR